MDCLEWTNNHVYCIRYFIFHYGFNVRKEEKMNHLEIFRSKIVAVPELKKLMSKWRFQDYKVAFTNGCFDILHPGHIHLLTSIADLGTKLIIGLNSDESVRLLEKGPNRPLQDQDSRALILASYSFVDAVVLFNESTPENLITQLKPDILVKGGDYAKEEIVGANLVEKAGGKVIVIPLLKGHSTSAIEQQMN